MFTGTAEAIARKRDQVVAEALSWVGTRFHHCAGVKGAGVDCANLVKAVYVHAGVVEDFELEPYSPQWFQHRDEPRFLITLARHARQVETPAPGDVAMLRFGRHAAHGAIVVGSRAIVHAYLPQGRVTTDDLGLYLPRLDSYWSPFQEAPWPAS